IDVVQEIAVAPTTTDPDNLARIKGASIEEAHRAAALLGDRPDAAEPARQPFGRRQRCQRQGSAVRRLSSQRKWARSATDRPPATSRARLPAPASHPASAIAGTGGRIRG